MVVDPTDADITARDPALLVPALPAASRSLGCSSRPQTSLKLVQAQDGPRAGRPDLQPRGPREFMHETLRKRVMFPIGRTFPVVVSHPQNQAVWTRPGVRLMPVPAWTLSDGALATGCGLVCWLLLTLLVVPELWAVNPPATPRPMSTLPLVTDESGGDNASHEAETNPRVGPSDSSTATDSVQFNRDVRPILSDKCFACHGFDPKHREADLRLDELPAGGIADGNWVIVPGDPENSPLMERILTTDEDIRMPPPSTHKSLTPEEVEVLKRWIAEGAPYEAHWSFTSIPDSVAVPELNDKDGTPLDPIDAFIRQALLPIDLEPAPPADRPTLVRRVAFALTGLPPTVAEVDSYVNDTSADAYEKMVDRYLASPRYGEEMARHWLDLARYADTHGLHLDNERQIWPYRDWVIRAYNANQPFDQFTIEQLAGDLLPDPTMDQWIATGFNRCNVTTSEGGSIDAEFLFRYAVERASTTSEVWMGLTAGCAVCHDHKFDPISQKEFYSLYAFFYSAADPAMDGNALLTQPVMRVETEADRARIDSFKAAITRAEADIEAKMADYPYRDPALADPRPAVQSLRTVWMDDEFPAGGKVQASPGHPTEFVATLPGEQRPVSGAKALKRTDPGLTQDVWEGGQVTLPLPPQPRFVAHVFLDPANPPRSVMVQFNKGGWNHRAVWGDYDAIDWGQKETFQRVHMGDLPPAGEWVTLEFPFDQLGLNAGDALNGFALTQFGGTVFWDAVGVAGEINPAEHPEYSFDAWWRQTMASTDLQLPTSLSAVHKAGPDASQAEDQIAALRRFYLAKYNRAAKTTVQSELASMAELEQELKAFENSLPSTFVFKDLPTPRQAHVMTRGQYTQPGEPVFPAVPAVLPGLPSKEGQRPTRLDLARWLVSPENPLTARVAVNRLWQQLFGTGLVKTSADFGSQGDPPSHPELLDWLANDFRSSGWDVKRLVRQIVTSQTFRQSSWVDPTKLERDPNNRWLARMPRLRLDAEQIRDNALLVSGLLNFQMGGKGVKPYQPANIWEPVGFAGSNTRFYTQDSGDALYRRSIYTFLKRTAPPPFMSNFDAPNRELSCSRRGRSNTPLQALQLMNDVQHIEAARVLGVRMIQEGGTEVRTRVGWAGKVVLARDLTPFEIDLLVTQWQKHRERYAADSEAARTLVSLGEHPLSAQIPVDELAAYTLVCNTLLNLDETLTRN